MLTENGIITKKKIIKKGGDNLPQYRSEATFEIRFK